MNSTWPNRFPPSRRTVIRARSGATSWRWDRSPSGWRPTARTIRNSPGGIGPTQLSTGGITATVYTSGGYRTLTAETSESRSLGLIWSPDYLGDFQVSVDYFDIIVEGEVGRVTNAYILRQCYDSPNFPAEPLCNLFTGNSRRTSAGPIKEIFNNYLNIAAQTSRGIDFEARHGLDIPWGDLDFTLRASRQLEKGEQLLPGSAFEDNNGENGEATNGSAISTRRSPQALLAQLGPALCRRHIQPG